MKRFVVQKHVNPYRELLESDTDWAARCILEQLLAEEQAKLVKLTEASKRRDSSSS